MKYLFCLLIAILGVTTLNGQNWRLIQHERIPIFSRDSNNIFAAIKVDSVTSAGTGDSLFWNYRSENVDCRCGNSGPSSTIWYHGLNGRCSARDTGWLGLPVIASGDAWRFITHQGDTLTLMPALPVGSAWTFCRVDPSTSVIATIISSTQELIFGQPDSVKEIEFTLVQGASTVPTLTDPKYRVRWSKHHGLIEGFYFYYLDLIKALNSEPLPLCHHVFLSGFQNGPGKKIPTNKSLYDFDLGDEFHYSGDVFYFNSSQWGGFGQVDHYAIKRVVTGKQVTQDSVKYTMLATKEYTKIISPQQPPQVTTSIYQMVFSKRLDDLYLLPDHMPADSMPSVGNSEMRIVDYRGALFESNGFNTRFPTLATKLKRSIKSTETLVDTAGYNFHSCFFEYGTVENYIEAEGVGLVLAEDLWTWDIGTKGYREELVYYSKGGVSEGTPIVLNVADNKENAPFKIYPNPITDYLVIDNSGAADEGISATLYNVAGAAVRSCEVATKGTVVLDTSVLPGGFYVLSVKASGGNLRNYKVVKH